MKNDMVLYLLLAYVFALNGCTIQPDYSGSKADRNAGLVFVRGETICQDSLTGKMWQFSKEGPFTKLEEADRYAANLRLGGYDDWRLPTKSELFNLFYLQYWKQDGNCVMNHRGEFWLISKSQDQSLGHWEDDLLCGPEFNFIESIKEDGFVRAIRP